MLTHCLEPLPKRKEIIKNLYANYALKNETDGEICIEEFNLGRINT